KKRDRANRFSQIAGQIFHLVRQENLPHTRVLSAREFGFLSNFAKSQTENSLQQKTENPDAETALTRLVKRENLQSIPSRKLDHRWEEARYLILASWYSAVGRKDETKEACTKEQN